MSKESAMSLDIPERFLATARNDNQSNLDTGFRR